jgi:hypothetical protein
VLFPIFHDPSGVIRQGYKPYFRHTLQKAFKLRHNEANHRNGLRATYPVVERGKPGTPVAQAKRDLSMRH